MKKQSKLDGLRSTVAGFKKNRERLADLQTAIKDEQPELIEALRSEGVDNETGLVIDSLDKGKGTAYVQQNAGSTVWDEEAVLDYVKRKKMWLKVSSRVFDINKWEALVASKEVPPKVAAKFQKKLDPPAPFIRFGKKGDKSL